MTFNPTVATCLRPHIHLAWCDADLVVLDTLADQYALLMDAAAVIQPGPNPGTVLVPADVRSELEALGLIAPDASPSTRREWATARTELDHSPSVNPASVIGAAFNSLVSTASFRRKTMAELVTTASQRRKLNRHRLDAAVAASAFRTVHPWIPFEGDCLQRGFMLHHHLHSAGIDARWVFGVRTWPFLAHCWVQVGDCVVGDTLERTQAFTPIMAV